VKAITYSQETNLSFYVIQKFWTNELDNYNIVTDGHATASFYFVHHDREEPISDLLPQNPLQSIYIGTSLALFVTLCICLWVRKWKEGRAYQEMWNR